MSKMKWVLYGLGLVFILLQFYRPDISVVKPGTSDTDLLQTVPGAPAFLKDACYDCHSNESTLPWYAAINPAGIFVRNHIREGRKHLNFSIIQDYPTDKKVKKLNECAEAVTEGWMPMDSYTWMHADARLTDEQRAELGRYFESAAAASLARDMNRQ